MQKRNKSIPIVDLFAGPGGLSEGFSSVIRNGSRVFDIRLSIEKDPEAHKTLELRSFFRQFPPGKVPDEYYELLRLKSTEERELFRKKLFQTYPVEAKKASQEAWCAELGSDKFPDSLIDTRIREALKGVKDWILIGGPPCQAFSLVGRSRRQWKDNLDENDDRVHLYKEYLRIIAVHQPAVFVMENVKGLLSSKLNGKKMFDLVKRDLKNPGYIFKKSGSASYKIFSLSTETNTDFRDQPTYNSDKDFIIKSEAYGVPQKRHRVILMGVRDDIRISPETLIQQEQNTLFQVISDLPRIRSAMGRSFVVKNKKRNYATVEDSYSNWRKSIKSYYREFKAWKKFKTDVVSINSVDPDYGIGSEFIKYNTPLKSNPLYDWYRDDKLKGVSNHVSRSHMIGDLKRYLFASIFTMEFKRFPRLEEYASFDSSLAPDHLNADSGKFNDRFRVQLPYEPATTITSHISKDGHYFIHYDPGQCRSFTVREAARIQTFPDNYLFCGSRTSQFQQVGNAVPPYLAKQIGEVVLKLFDKAFFKK